MARQADLKQKQTPENATENTVHTLRARNARVKSSETTDQTYIEAHDT